MCLVVYKTQQYKKNSKTCQNNDITRTQKHYGWTEDTNATVLKINATCIMQRSRFFVKQGITRDSAMVEGPRDALLSRNSATTKHPI